MKALLVILLLVVLGFGGYYVYQQAQNAEQSLSAEEEAAAEERGRQAANDMLWEAAQEAQRKVQSAQYAVEKVLESWRDRGWTAFDKSDKKLMSPQRWEVRKSVEGNAEAYVTVFVVSSSQGGSPVNKTWVFDLTKNTDGEWRVVHVRDADGY